MKPWRLVVVLLTLTLAGDTPAAEVQLFGEILRSSYERPSGSLWQQEFAGYPTEWDTRKTGFRIGGQYGLVRLSYFDLGTYHIAGEAADDEEGVVACNCKVAGDTDWYYTTGSIRGFALSLRPTWHHLFFEVGLTRVRQGFKETKDDGWYENYTRTGMGTLLGIGVEYKNTSMGVYRYTADVTFPTPTGTGGAFVYALGYRF